MHKGIYVLVASVVEGAASSGSADGDESNSGERTPLKAKSPSTS